MKLNDYLKIEQQYEAEFCSVNWKDIPIWRILRSEFRVSYLNEVDCTVKVRIKLSEVVVNVMKSLFGFIKLLFQKKKKYLFFSFPRLSYMGDYYIDKLFDPLIDNSICNDNYIIFERHQNSHHYTPRYHSRNVIYLDLIDNFVLFLHIIISPFSKRFCDKKVDELYCKLVQAFEIDEEYRRYLKSCFLRYKLKYFFYSKIIFFLNPKAVFVAPRGVYNSVICAAKKKGIITYEMQHGIVLGESISYSGSYCNSVDPDIFLIFGKDNVGSQYGMPVNRVVNIGFPFKTYISNIGLPAYDDNVILLISEPHITDKIIQIAINLTNVVHNRYVFHIRCHPAEELSEKQKREIDQYDNIINVDNKIESWVVLSQYKAILGEMSSVVYEALALNKRVGLLNFGGLHAVQTNDIYGGIPINSENEFESFMQDETYLSYSKSELYSDFSVTLFNQLLN